MMLTNSIGLFLWALNLIFDNNGDWMHMVWLRISEAWIISPIITMIFAAYAWNSYGSRAQVYTSWSGSDTYASVALANADHKYLMWRADPTGVNVPSSTYTLKANLTSQGYDTFA
jgi:hypothetical protein